jgi:ABC-2 type transport system permease protein
MRNVWTITTRELKAFFVSPIAYVVSALFLAMMGYLFQAILLSQRDANLRGEFSNLTFVLLLVAPALTMRLIAEEQQMGTIELLLTAPVREWQVILGKFLGGLILYAIMFLVPTLYYVLILFAFGGNPDPGPLLSSYLGLLLLGGSFLAIGVFTSSLTRNQVIAYIAGLAILILLWLADAATSFAGTGSISDAISYLAITRHYDNFLNGVIDTTDVVYLLSAMVVSLFLATQVLQTRRWR